MKKNLSRGEVAGLCMELSLLLHAGVTVGDAVSLLAEESEGDRRETLETMAQWVDNGETLSAAMGEVGCFPTYARGMVEVGERSGHTEEALSALARYYEKRERMERQIRSALLYPAVLVGLMLVVIGVLLVKVLPIFDDVYASLGGRLTGVAAGLLVAGRWLSGAMPFLWGLLALLALLALAVAFLPAWREKLLALWQKRWGDRGVARKIATAHVAQALSMGMSSGMPPEEALELAEKLVGDGAKKRCADCRDMLRQGRPTGEAMKESGLLPPAQCRLFETAQRSGTGDTAMAHIAETLEEEGDQALEGKVARLEPVLVLICAVLVGMILLSVMLPLTHIMSAIG